MPGSRSCSSLPRAAQSAGEDEIQMLARVSDRLPITIPRNASLQETSSIKGGARSCGPPCHNTAPKPARRSVSVALFSREASEIAEGSTPSC